MLSYKLPRLSLLTISELDLCDILASHVRGTGDIVSDCLAIGLKEKKKKNSKQKSTLLSLWIQYSCGLSSVPHLPLW